MAQNTKHRRCLTTPESQCNLTLQSYCPKPFSVANSGHPASKSSEPTVPSKAHCLPANFHRLNTTHKVSTPWIPTNLQQKPLPASRGIHFQAKALNLSSDFGSIKTLQKLAHGTDKQKKIEDPCKKTSNTLDDLRSSTGIAEEVVHIKKFDSLSLDRQSRGQFTDGAEPTARKISVSSSMAGGMRRRSFCGLQVELGEVFASSGVKVVSADMPPFVQIHAVDCARKAYDSLEKLSCKSLALTLKKEFDGAYGPAWHCIVGASFGSFVTHSVGGFMYFSMDRKMYILLFKTTVQRAK